MLVTAWLADGGLCTIAPDIFSGTLPIQHILCMATFVRHSIVPSGKRTLSHLHLSVFIPECVWGVGPLAQ